MSALLTKRMTRRFRGAHGSRIMVIRNFLKSDETQYARGFQANCNQKTVHNWELCITLLM